VLWSAADPRKGTSGYGSGKTALARMAYECLSVMRDHQGQPQRATFLTAIDLFQMIKDGYSTDQAIGPIFDRWLRGHVLIDDWGRQYTTESGALWAMDQFFRLINGLYELGRGLLITSNLPPGQIEAQIGGASYSRLAGMCGPNGFIDMSGIPDYRLKQGGFYG
jgi:DNA replication protein DnaC